MRYRRFSTFKCQGLLNKVKQMNVADEFYHHQLTAMIVQEIHMHGHGLHQVESSSGEKYIFIYPVIKTEQLQELV